MENNNNNNNVNVENFATVLSGIIGQTIGLKHIHPTTESRDFYIQAPKLGAPIILYHYRHVFCLDIHPDDFERIFSGEVSAYDYIKSANWQVGYFKGGYSMFEGGYYQPIDIIGRKEEVRRYLKILSCRTEWSPLRHKPSKERCANCSVENCTFSDYTKGKRVEEISELDPRVDLFEALCRRFEQEYPGYTFHGFYCKEIVPEGEIWIYPTPFSCFKEGDLVDCTAYASNADIQSLMMHENEPENWNDYAKNFQFKNYKSDTKNDELTKENLKKACDDWLQRG